jgi:hypothetical protein
MNNKYITKEKKNMNNFIKSDNLATADAEVFGMIESDLERQTNMQRVTLIKDIMVVVNLLTKLSN